MRHRLGLPDVRSPILGLLPYWRHLVLWKFIIFHFNSCHSFQRQIFSHISQKCHYEWCSCNGQQHWQIKTDHCLSKEFFGGQMNNRKKLVLKVQYIGTTLHQPRVKRKPILGVYMPFDKYIVSPLSICPIQHTRISHCSPARQQRVVW